VSPRDGAAVDPQPATPRPAPARELVGETPEEWLIRRGYVHADGAYRHYPWWASGEWWLAAVWLGASVAVVVLALAGVL